MDIVFNGGDEVRQPFRIMVGADIADLTNCTVSARILPYSNMVLTEGAGIIIINRAPSDDDPHGYFVFDEETTAMLPQGRIARVRFIVVDPAVITTSTSDTYLARAG